MRLATRCTLRCNVVLWAAICLLPGSAPAQELVTDLRITTLSTMLTLAAAGASNVPGNAAFWIIGGGIGFSIMLIAGFLEAYRSRSGALMRRLGDLMEDWE